MIRRISAVLSLLAALVLLTTISGSAAPAIVRSGLIVSPAIEQINLQAGQTNISFEASVTNDTPSTVTIVARTDDFTALNETGSPLFLNNTTHDATPHGLSHWMTVVPSVFTLRSGEEEDISVTITGVISMAPGGHYGAVIFGILPMSTSSASQNTIASNTEVSVLILLTTADAGEEAVQLTKPQIASASLLMPSSVDLLFVNSGNVQTSPHGIVTIYDKANNEVARGVINIDSGVILPGTSRLYQVSLVSQRSFNWPGEYHVSIFYRAGENGKGESYDVSFLFISQPVILLLGLIPAAAALLLLRKLSTIVIHYRLK